MSSTFTLLRARQRRAELLEDLREIGGRGVISDEYYGGHDPFDVPLAACESCGVTPEKPIKVGDDPIRWLVACPSCGRRPKEHRKAPWSAALAWNADNLGTQDYQSMPLFNLAGKPPI